MKLVRARIQNYRSIRDTDYFAAEPGKTILVGPNEAGKSAILQALQHVNPPKQAKGFIALRDYPRALYDDIPRKKVKTAEVPVVTAEFDFDRDDLELVPPEWRDPSCRYVIVKYLDNSYTHHMTSAPEVPTYAEIKQDLDIIASVADRGAPEAGAKPCTEMLAEITANWGDDIPMWAATSGPLRKWLGSIDAILEDNEEDERQRRAAVTASLERAVIYERVMDTLYNRVPVFVLFTNYFRVRPRIHLGQLASRVDSGNLDSDQYDYGNLCLLKLLGFTAKELSRLGNVTDPKESDTAALERYRDQLDDRSYQLNAASMKLTKEIQRVWNPNHDGDEMSRLRVVADGQYLKVVVEDELGIEVELDQRSEGFQWLVSFFIVFFAEAAGRHSNAVLLLDEPGTSLHALKQRGFRQTLSRLAAANQTLITTHSPFLVGPDELDLVRVVELADRRVGTKVHTSVTSKDPAALFPLQEALGYELAQSLFAQRRNLILQGLTDLWYLEAAAGLLREFGGAKLNDEIALIPASTASKVMYLASVLLAHKGRVAILMDSDAADDEAKKQELLARALRLDNVLLSKDYINPPLARASVEDLLRNTLIGIAKADLGWNIESAAVAHPEKPIVETFASEIGENFSKFRLAKAFVRWSRDHSAAELSDTERQGWSNLISAINAALK